MQEEDAESASGRSIIDDLSIPDKPTEATELLAETFDLDDTCNKCDIALELGLVLGNASFAAGVLVCPNCGYYGRNLTADPDGKGCEDEYKQLVESTMRWVPPWHPGSADVTSDWRCHCGRTWKSSEIARKHIQKHHPEKTRLSMVQHDRYPWKNVEGDANEPA